MPAPLAKGILISLSILAAIGIAVYENPQVKEWVEDQRRKITEFLRTFGDELDPQSRREAEAFAYEGRLPTQGPEAVGSANTVARATGRETSSDDAVSRRLRTSHEPQSPDEASERRRLGREYLARRNQEMLDTKEKQKMRKSMSGESEKTPSSPTFDQLVNADGSLKADEQSGVEQQEEFNEKTLELPSVPTEEPKSLLRKIPIEEAPIEVHTGFRYANPFGDEYELSGSMESRSPTPKPPVPPKIALDSNKVRKLSVTQKKPSIRQIPIFDQEDEAPPTDLSYDEQLARALSLSLAESEAVARLARAKQEEEQDPDYAAAVAASLEEAEQEKRKQEENQLVNLTPDPPLSVPDTDELYTLSPNMTLRHLMPAPIPGPMIIPPYDPVHEAALSQSPPQQRSQTPPSQPLHSPTTATFSSPEVERDAISFSSASSAAASEAFASAPASVANSEMSLIDFGEVESVDSDESDDDGVLTPGSWTDVGSDVDSEDLERRVA